MQESGFNESDSSVKLKMFSLGRVSRGERRRENVKERAES